MAQSLSKLYIHIIFHIKSNSVAIREEDESKLYAYIGSIIKSNQSIPIIINGTHNHLHIFLILSKNISLSKMVEEIKKHSSRWIKSQSGYYTNFSWQNGYMGISVSPSIAEKTKKYISNQKEHHKKMNFREEYLMFLKKYEIEFNNDFLWTD